MKRGSAHPDEPPVARMRGRGRHPGAIPHVAEFYHRARIRATHWLMRAAGILAEMGEGKKKRPISSYAMALLEEG